MLDAIEKKYELINGREVMMSPANTGHNSIQMNLAVILWNYLKGKRCKLFSETMVRFDENNHFVPDLLVVCDRSKIKASHIEGAPDLVVEILSPSTGRRDLGIKKDTYEKFGVREYWVIDPKSKSILVYHRKDGKFAFDDRYAVLEEWEVEAMSEEEKAEHRLTLKVSLYDDLEIDVKEIFDDMV